MTRAAAKPRAGGRTILVTACIAAGTLYVALAVGFGLFVVDWTSPLGPLFFVGYELLCLGHAYQLATSVLSLALAPSSLPRLSPLPAFPPVALVMTLCDDAVPAALERLNRQTYPRLDVFLLDDSRDPGTREFVDRTGRRHGYTVVRRGTRQHFKAGNLNHWLERYGAAYRYVVVFDSDSHADEDFVARMVEYAEHPCNARIAIFQSSVLPWHECGSFARLLGTVAPMRLHVLRRVFDRLDAVFCFGHNYLVRLGSLREVGGFPYQVTCEDTALTLALSAAGHLSRLVDVPSYDAEPATPPLYARRTVRWARQTVEVFRHPWPGASLRLKLVLCQHLYAYAVYGVYLTMLLLSAWSYPAPGWDPGAATGSDPVYRTPAFVLVGFVALLWTAQAGLQVVLARRTGVRLWDLCRYALLITPLTFAFVFPMLAAMLGTALGRAVHFKPTNQTGGAPARMSLSQVARGMKAALAYSALLWLGVLLHNHFLVFTLNGLWALLLTATPVVLWRIQGHAAGQPFQGGG